MKGLYTDDFERQAKQKFFNVIGSKHHHLPAKSMCWLHLYLKRKSPAEKKLQLTYWYFIKKCIIFWNRLSIECKSIIHFSQWKWREQGDNNGFSLFTILLVLVQHSESGRILGIDKQTLGVFQMLAEDLILCQNKAFILLDFALSLPNSQFDDVRFSIAQYRLWIQVLKSSKVSALKFEDPLIVWLQLWNLLVYQVKFNRFLYPNEHIERVFWLIGRLFEVEPVSLGHIFTR